MGVIKDWASAYAAGTALDSETSMPTLTSLEDIRASHMVALRDSLIALEQRVGKNRGSDPCWNYLDTTLPTGVPSTTLQSLYQFDGSSSSHDDRSGNVSSLTPIDQGLGAWPWGYVTSPTTFTRLGGLTGKVLGGNTLLESSTANYPVGADVTWEVVLWLNAPAWVFNCELVKVLPAAGSVRTWQWTLGLNCTAGGFASLYYMFVVETHPAAPEHSAPTLAGIHKGNLMHITLVRASTGLHSIYLQGELAATEQRCWVHNMAHNLPVNTTAAGKLDLGGYETSLVMFSFRQCAWPFTAAQVRESYRRVRTAR